MDGTAGPPRTAALRGIPLCCPGDGRLLLQAEAGLLCSHCGTCYPAPGGVPVLIHDARSAFAIADYIGGAGYEGAAYGRAADAASGPRRWWRRLARALGDAPSSIRHPGPEAALGYVAALRPSPRVLVVGSGGLRLGGPADCVVQIDVAFAPGVDAIADGHDLPFPDGTFDLVVAVAVLEHVADPQRCVAEIRRVLAPGGHVHAVTPFLQPVHMGAYDFTRFTPIGHRRLFRGFDEVAAGIALGTGSVAASTLRGALLSVSSRRWWRVLAGSAALLATPVLRRLDRWLPNGADAASACWFFGRRREGDPVSDRALVGSYREGFGMGPLSLPRPPSRTAEAASPIAPPKSRT
ncbi:class I SAM-dependent methyltransferase [Roseococcus sp. SYP-B2431]|uniref:class I SAM-dependent methyltransferase n=1 Tax=Roseococcus sp. SYP-B2431 TaxID=2496640 RepID=UPI00103D765D|nr:class I SAM-dependent methyltransferase [Roseococcus sp. SYP-B2431]TCH96307.1 class I SAM-dependent methyltransferase [Roseococcus sp. SYP-B2431]